MEADYKKIYDQIMSQISEIIETNINEAFGIKEYENKQYDKEILDIASDILQLFKTPLQYNAVLVENDDEICKLFHKKYVIRSIKWLQTLHVYLTSYPILSYDPDIFMVADKSFGYNKERNKIEEYKYSFQLFNNTKPVEPLIIRNNKIIKASIIISVPDRYNIGIISPIKSYIFKADELSFILKHELSHLYDLLSNNITIKQLNTDLLEQESYLTLDETYEQIATTLLSNNDVNNKVKSKTIKEKITAQNLHNLFVENIYLLNKSEMRARLQNCRYEIKKNIDKVIYNHVKQNLLRQISRQFETYYILYELFGLLIQYTPDNIKQEFVEQSIKEYFGKPRPDNYEPKYPYNKSFKNDKNTYDINSFDSFFEYHRKNIYDIFLHNAMSIFEQYFDDPNKGLKGLNHQIW